MILIKKTIDSVFGVKNDKKQADHDLLNKTYLNENISKEVRKIKDIFIDKSADALVENICKRLLRYLWFLPASEGHHHAQEFGLFSHCLDTGIRAIRIFDEAIFFEYRDNNDIDSFETRKKRVHKQYAFFVCGLLHDIGKVAGYRISANDGTEWNPCNDLYDFITANRLSFTDIKYRSENDLYSRIEKITPFFGARLMTAEDYSYIGRDDTADIMKEIGFKKDYAHNFSGIIKDADMQSTSNNIDTEPPKNDLISSFIEELKRMLHTGKVAINTPAAKAWVFENYTAVHISVLNEIRTLLHSENTRTPDVNIILKRMVERKCVDFVDWKCIYGMEIVTAGKPYTIKVVKFKNSLLWDRSQKIEVCKLNIVFNI